MFSKYASIFLLFNVFLFCESGFVDTLQKCEITDEQCGKKLLQKVLKDLAKTGADDIGLPPIDPIELKNITVKVLNLLEITLIDGVGKGVQNCIINKFEINFEDKHALVALSCDIVITGRYKLYLSSPILKPILNSDIVQGDGNGTVQLDQINVNLNYYFFTEERNGETYIKFKNDKTKFDYVLNNMKFYADNIYVGGVESSKMVVDLLNENWKFLMASFGKPFMDEAASLIFHFVQKFFDGVPAKYYAASLPI